MKRKRNLAWHFIKGNTLRDGTKAPADGVWLEYNGELKLCKSGLHYSRQPFDALQYAPGNTLCLVEVGGRIVENEGDDKGVCSHRKIIARMDAEELLRYFARMQALSVLHLWDTEQPEVVCDYLMTGDEALRGAAYSAARRAAYSAASAASAAYSAAYSAASAASAAYSAAYSAASSAAREEFNSLVYECFSDFL